MYINSGPSRGDAQYLAVENVVLLKVCISAFLKWAVGINFTLPAWVDVKDRERESAHITESIVATNKTIKP